MDGLGSFPGNPQWINDLDRTVGELEQENLTGDDILKLVTTAQEILEKNEAATVPGHLRYPETFTARFNRSLGEHATQGHLIGKEKEIESVAKQCLKRAFEMKLRALYGDVGIRSEQLEDYESYRVFLIPNEEGGVAVRFKFDEVADGINYQNFLPEPALIDKINKNLAVLKSANNDPALPPFYHSSYYDPNTYEPHYMILMRERNNFAIEIAHQEQSGSITNVLVDDPDQFGETLKRFDREAFQKDLAYDAGKHFSDKTPSINEFGDKACLITGEVDSEGNKRVHLHYLEQNQVKTITKNIGHALISGNARIDFTNEIKEIEVRTAIERTQTLYPLISIRMGDKSKVNYVEDDYGGFFDFGQSETLKENELLIYPEHELLRYLDEKGEPSFQILETINFEKLKKSAEVVQLRWLDRHLKSQNSNKEEFLYNQTQFPNAFTLFFKDDHLTLSVGEKNVPILGNSIEEWAVNARKSKTELIAKWMDDLSIKCSQYLAQPNTLPEETKGPISLHPHLDGPSTSFTLKYQDPNGLEQSRYYPPTDIPLISEHIEMIEKSDALIKKINAEGNPPLKYLGAFDYPTELGVFYFKIDYEKKPPVLRLLHIDPLKDMSVIKGFEIDTFEKVFKESQTEYNETKTKFYSYLKEKFGAQLVKEPGTLNPSEPLAIVPFTHNLRLALKLHYTEPDESKAEKIFKPEELLPEYIAKIQQGNTIFNQLKTEAAVPLHYISNMSDPAFHHKQGVFYVTRDSSSFDFVIKHLDPLSNKMSTVKIPPNQLSDTLKNLERTYQETLQLKSWERFEPSSDLRQKTQTSSAVPPLLPEAPPEKLLELFQLLNFTDPAKPNYLDPRLITEDNTVIGVDRLNTNMQKLVRIVKDGGDFTVANGHYFGIPDQPEEKEKYFHNLRAYLSQIVTKLQAPEVDPTIRNEVILSIAIGASHCGGRWAGEAVQHFNILSGRSGESLYEYFLSFSDLLKIDIVEKMASEMEEGLELRGRDSHVYLAMCRALSQGAGLGIPASAGANYHDPYGGNALAGTKYPDENSVRKGFMKKFNGPSIVTFVRDQANDQFRAGRQKFISMAMAGLRDLVREQVEADPRVKEELAPIEKALNARQAAIHNARELSKDGVETIITRNLLDTKLERPVPVKGTEFQQRQAEILNQITERRLKAIKNIDSNEQWSYGEKVAQKRADFEVKSQEYAQAMRQLKQALLEESGSDRRYKIESLIDARIEANKYVVEDEATLLPKALTAAGTAALLLHLKFLEPKK